MDDELTKFLRLVNHGTVKELINHFVQTTNLNRFSIRQNIRRLTDKKLTELGYYANDNSDSSCN